MGLGLWGVKFGLLDRRSLAHQEAWVSKVEVEAFIGDDKGVRVLHGSLNLLLCTAPWVCASVVTPVHFFQGIKISNKKFTIYVVDYDKCDRGMIKFQNMKVSQVRFGKKNYT